MRWSFNPLPSPKQGETTDYGGSQDVPVVSIRSPHRSKGRLRSVDARVEPQLFQSAPLTEARGDGTFTRAFFGRIRVSIRSPHRSKGRPGIVAGVTWFGKCFNPLPSPKQGETLKLSLLSRLLLVSIRSPHRSKGRLDALPSSRSVAAVSIRSPHRSKGRLATFFAHFQQRQGFNPLPSPKQGETDIRVKASSKIKSFQSAPLTEARGDLGHKNMIPFVGLFQSAPLTEARGDFRSLLMRLGGRGFNPLPSPKQGETSQRHTTSSEAPQFQSAPLTEARGDIAVCVVSAGIPCFNPLPSPKQGETAVK